MNTERLIHMPQCCTIDLSALCNSSNSIWKTIESHRWVKLSCENIGMCLSYVPFTLIKRLINCWNFIQIWFDNKMPSSQWDINNNQHFVSITVGWYLLGIIARQGFLFTCSCINRCICFRSRDPHVTTVHIGASNHMMSLWNQYLFHCFKTTEHI